MSDYITKTDLKNVFGLSDKEIALLGEPDATKRNPHYPRAGAPMRLYARERVLAFLAANPDIAERANVRLDRRAKAAMQRASRDAEISSLANNAAEQWVSAQRVVVRPDARARLAQARARGLPEHRLLDYARHECTNYDELLDQSRRHFFAWSCDIENQGIVTPDESLDAFSRAFNRAYAAIRQQAMECVDRLLREEEMQCEQ